MKEKEIKPKAGRKSLAGLLPAARRGKVEQLRALLDDGANIERKNNHGHTALVQAAGCGRSECVQLLLDRGADVNAGRRVSALAYASLNGHMECIRILLDYGADIDLPSYYGMTPLMCACFHGRNECVALLLERGADTTVIDSDGQTVASYCFSAEMSKLLLDASNKTDYVLK